MASPSTHTRYNMFQFLYIIIIRSIKYPLHLRCVTKAGRCQQIFPKPTVSNFMKILSASVHSLMHTHGLGEFNGRSARFGTRNKDRNCRFETTPQTLLQTMHIDLTALAFLHFGKSNKCFLFLRSLWSVEGDRKQNNLTNETFCISCSFLVPFVSNIFTI
jgi:hypothetical protein